MYVYKHVCTLIYRHLLHVFDICKWLLHYNLFQGFYNILLFRKSFESGSLVAIIIIVSSHPVCISRNLSIGNLSDNLMSDARINVVLLDMFLFYYCFRRFTV